MEADDNDLFADDFDEEYDLEDLSADENVQYKNLKTKSAKEVAKKVYELAPSDWWNNLWTPKNR